MTQAFNLAQFANRVNTSGQVDASTALTNAVPVANGGTGATTLAANNVLLGNGSSTPQTIAPGTAGNLLASNGSTWVSQSLGSLGGFNSSLTANGYQYLPSGLLVQWRLLPGFASGTTYLWPIAFPTNTFVMFSHAIGGSVPTGNNVIVGDFVGLTGFALWSAISQQVYLLAIGK